MISIRLMTVVMLTAVVQVRAAADDEQKQRTIDLRIALCNGAPSQQIQDLVERGVDINAKVDLYKRTLCHFAAGQDREEAITIFVAKGADLSARNEFGFTPLHVACYMGASKATQALLGCGANTQEKDARGRTSADIAREDNHYDIVKLIEDYENTSNVKEPSCD